MALVRADLGTPHLTTCIVCHSGSAQEHPIVVLSWDEVAVEPWVLITCRACGFLGKARAPQIQEPA